MSLRGGRASLSEAFARVRDGEVWLEGMHIPAYEPGNAKTHLPIRPRKLLLHRREIAQLWDAQQQDRLVLVPLRVYFSHGLAKVELAWVLADGAEAVGNLGGVQAVQVSQLTFDLAAQYLSRSRQVA